MIPARFPATYAVLAYVTGNAIYADYLDIPYVTGAGELTIFMMALVGAGPVPDGGAGRVWIVKKKLTLRIQYTFSWAMRRVMQAAAT